MIGIFLSTCSKKEEVVTFLRELKVLLEKEDAKDNLILIRKKKQGKDQKYSTYYTLFDLEYDIGDVIDRLKELTIEEYSETKIDKDDINPPLLFVFGKNINRKLVYIKLKVKEDQRKYVLCVSFHYAKESMKFPYA